MPSAMSSRTDCGRCSERPMKSRRILFFCMVGSSRLRYSRSKRIRNSTSACGRRQFSREKAYSVRQGMCRREQVSMMTRAALHAGAMARDARQMAALRPAAVAIHDDGASAAAGAWGRVFREVPLLRGSGLAGVRWFSPGMTRRSREARCARAISCKEEKA